MAVSADWMLFVAFHLPAEIFSNLILGIPEEGSNSGALLREHGEA